MRNTAQLAPPAPTSTVDRMDSSTDRIANLRLVGLSHLLPG
jgi:hypothetical protein